MKRIAALTVLLVLLFSSVTAYAVEPRAKQARPTLSFNGTTALCGVSILDYGKKIDITLTLWQGSQQVKQWSASGTSTVSISESCAVEKGKSYRLTVSGTVGGETLSGSTSGQCG